MVVACLLELIRLLNHNGCAISVEFGIMRSLIRLAYDPD